MASQDKREKISKKRIDKVMDLYQYDMGNLKDTSLIDPVIEKIPEIDKIISDNLVGYTLKRLSYVDRAIIRLATYEMKYEGLNKRIAINEAINITKEYSDLEDGKQHKFNNSVLDKIARSLGL